MEDVPIAGLGGLLWLALIRKAGPQAFLKPSPVHVLAALALRAAYHWQTPCSRPRNLALDGILIPPGGRCITGVTIFEDTTGGMQTAQAAQAVLEIHSINIQLELCGITTNPSKAQALESIGAVTYPDINAALQARLA